MHLGPCRSPRSDAFHIDDRERREHGIRSEHTVYFFSGLQRWRHEARLALATPKSHVLDFFERDSRVFGVRSATARAKTRLDEHIGRSFPWTSTG
jgi:hypothetical protein